MFNFLQLLHYVKKVHFKNTAGEQVFFDKNGDIPISIDILNWWLYPNGSNQYVYVGKYDGRAPEGSKLQIDENKIMWNGHKQVSFALLNWEEHLYMRIQ